MLTRGGGLGKRKGTMQSTGVEGGIPAQRGLPPGFIVEKQEESPHVNCMLWALVRQQAVWKQAKDAGDMLCVAGAFHPCWA